LPESLFLSLTLRPGASRIFFTGDRWLRIWSARDRSWLALGDEVFIEDLRATLGVDADLFELPRCAVLP
jgi:hypothetical protein